MKAWVQHKEGDISEIKLFDNAMASGGEGKLYRIETPGYETVVAKIYHENKRTELRHNKIKYLQQHPPVKFDSEDKITLVWPKELLFNEKKEFIGFLMPFVKGEKLELLCLPKIPKKYEKEWDAYEFAVDVRMKKRLDICYKISKAIHNIHSTGHYILIDMKPDNIVIDTKGNIALVDLDSVEVVENGETLFDAPVATPEYTPPDSYLKDQEIDPTQEDPWDRFGLGVILYKILVGIHPFAASSEGPYEQYNNLYQKIEQGLFVHDQEHQKHFSVIPELHERFYKLPLNIQKLFIRCFVEGHHKPFARPASEEWAKALRQYDRNQNIDEDKLKIPQLALEQLPENLNTEKLYELPETSIISQYPQILVNKKADKKELKNHQLPETILNPKEIKSQRFFNFMCLLFIVVVSTAMSIIMPWQMTLGIGIAAYTGINYLTYRSRKTADRKDTIISIMNNHMSYFGELIKSAEDYEQKISICIEKLKKLSLNSSKEYLTELLEKKTRIKKKAGAFNKFIEEEKKKILKLKRQGKVAFRQLYNYYEEQVTAKTKLPEMEAATLQQKIFLLQRAKRLGKLNEEEKLRYNTDLTTLEELQVQLEIEEAEIIFQQSEKTKDIQYRCRQKHSELLEEITIFHDSFENGEEEKIKIIIEEQRKSLKDLDQLQYDLNRLEKPLEEQVSACIRAKRDAELYSKINFGRHMFQMLGMR